jgi:hypothetical protein
VYVDRQVMISFQKKYIKIFLYTTILYYTICTLFWSLENVK